MSDSVVLRALYENRKQFMVVNYRVHGEKTGYEQSHMYAISHDLFPVFHQDESLAKEGDPYSDCYRIKEAEVLRIIDYVDSEWLAGKLHDFYELEAHFGGRRIRWTLMCVLRYCYLDRRFDDQLWNKLIRRAPTEATSITRDLADWDI